MKRKKSLNLQVVHHYSAPKTQEKPDSSPLQQLIHKQLGQRFIVFDQKEIVALLFTFLIDHEEKSHHLDTFAGYVMIMAKEDYLYRVYRVFINTHLVLKLIR